VASAEIAYRRLTNYSPVLHKYISLLCFHSSSFEQEAIRTGNKCSCKEILACLRLATNKDEHSYRQFARYSSRFLSLGWTTCYFSDVSSIIQLFHLLGEKQTKSFMLFLSNGGNGNRCPVLTTGPFDWKSPCFFTRMAELTHRWRELIELNPF
jgi:hypothetical protein